MRVHLKIGKKDADLIYWIESLPSRCFSHYASKILEAEAKKKIANIPVYENEGLSEGIKEVAIYVQDKQAIAMLREIPKGKKSQYIKKIVRKHIAANYRKYLQKQEEKRTDEKAITEPLENKNNETDFNSTVAQSEPEEPVEVNDFRAKMMQMMNR